MCLSSSKTNVETHTMLFLASRLCLCCSPCQFCSFPTLFFHLAHSYFRIQNSHHLLLDSLLRLHLPSETQLCASILFSPSSHAAVNLSLPVYLPVHSLQCKLLGTEPMLYSSLCLHPGTKFLKELTWTIGVLSLHCLSLNVYNTNVYSLRDKYYYSHFTN